MAGKSGPPSPNPLARFELVVKFENTLNEVFGEARRREQLFALVVRPPAPPVGFMIVEVELCLGDGFRLLTGNKRPAASILRENQWSVEFLHNQSRFSHRERFVKVKIEAHSFGAKKVFTAVSAMFESNSREVWLNLSNLLVQLVPQPFTFCFDSTDRKSTRLNSSHANISYAV